MRSHQVRLFTQPGEQVGKAAMAGWGLDGTAENQQKETLFDGHIVQEAAPRARPAERHRG